jgi:hypothetical protein
VRPFLKTTILFLSLLCLVYPILVLFTGLFIPQLFKPNINYVPGAYGQLNLRVIEAKNSPGNIDILFLGSSHAYRGFDTRNFPNCNTFNLGSSAQTPINTKALLLRYLDKLNPKAVVFEVYPESFGGDGSESSLDVISNDRNDLCSFNMARATRNVKVYNTFIYAALRDLLSLNVPVHDTINGSDKYIPGGFVETEIRYYKFVEQDKRTWTFDKKQLQCFTEIIGLLNKKKIETTLVFAPITSRLYNSYTNNNYADSVMSSFGLTYLNFNKLLNLNDSLHFYDAHHLNQNGVNIFNKKLTEAAPKLFNCNNREN